MKTNCKKTCQICKGPTWVKITTSLPKTTTTTTPTTTTTKIPKTTKTTTYTTTAKNTGSKTVPCKDTKHPSLVYFYYNS